MGIFTRRRTAVTWTPDGTGVVDGGQVAGDQIGLSYSVRYIRPDLPGSMITITWFVVQKLPGHFDIERETEWLVCRDPADPGGTEIWSDTEYDDVPTLGFGTLAAAEAEARRHAEDGLHTAAEYDTWDGEPDWSAA